MATFLGRQARAAALPPAMRKRDFDLLLGGSTFLFLSWWMQHVILAWMALQVTKSPYEIGLVTFFLVTPNFVFSYPGGVLADLIDRRRLLITAQLVVLFLDLPLVIMSLADRLPLWQIYVLAVVNGTLISLHGTARQAMVVDLVGRSNVGSAVAIISMIYNGSRIVGPAVAGLLIAGIGAGGALAVAIASYVFVLVSLWVMRYDARYTDAGHTSFWQGVAGGAKFALTDRTVAGLCAVFAVTTLLGMPIGALFPLFARDVLGAGSGGLGLIYSAYGAGSLIMAAFLSVADATLQRKGLILMIAQCLYGASLLVFSLSRSFPLSLLSMVMIGMTIMLQLNLVQTLFQLTLPNELRGRGMSIYSLLLGASGAGSLPMAMLADHWGAPLSGALAGALCVIFGLTFLLKVPSVRTIS